MSDEVDHELDLSPNGHIRCEEILRHILQASRARQNRKRRLSAVAIAAIGLAFAAMAWTQFRDTAQMFSHAPPSLRSGDPEATPTLSDSLVLLYPHLDVEIITGNEPLDRSASRHHAIALERISDEQLISQFSDAQLPFGLLIADGKFRLLPHASSHARQRRVLLHQDM